MTSVVEKLKDPTATFTQSEMYAVFEELAETYGFYRDQRLPERNSVQETTSMVVDGFEHLGAVVVRPRTNRDAMITIPSVVDRILGNNMTPSNGTYFNATAIAMAETLIISPPGFVERLLESTNIQDLNFFGAFTEQYKAWQESLTKEAQGKGSGPEAEDDGTKSASLSATSTASPPPTPDG
jgi:hypothetical protein